jgi:hypothetical protein
MHPHLHRTAEEIRTFGATFAGMAGPANTGPAGTYCSQCRFWSFAQKRLSSNPQKAAPCGLYRKRMGFVGPSVLGGASSCSGFLHIGAAGAARGPSSPPQQTSFLLRT